MKKNYSFEKTEFLPFVYNSEISDIILSYRNTLATVGNILGMFLDADQFSLELLQKQNLETSCKLIFKALANDKEVFFEIENDYVCIHYENCDYFFGVDWDIYHLYAKLLSLTFWDGDKSLIQRINSQKVYLDLIIKDKIYSLEIPYHTYYYYEADVLASINEASSILDIKRVYMEKFYDKQTDFEKSCNSLLMISTVNEDGKKIVLDKLVIQDGFVQSYKLSVMKQGLLISLNGAMGQPEEVTVENYQIKTGIDLNVEAEKLYKRSRTLNFFIK